MERLKAVLQLYQDKTVLKFTFQYGEIKSVGLNPFPIGYFYLHSSMERLKERNCNHHHISSIIFTFQYGEIKRNFAVSASGEDVLFTFQYGEIKSDPASSTPLAMLIFTFQYGEIKSCCRAISSVK